MGPLSAEQCQIPYAWFVNNFGSQQGNTVVSCYHLLSKAIIITLVKTIHMPVMQ